MNKKLIIIAGVAGEIGTCFAKNITEQGVDVIGVTRNRKVKEETNIHFSSIECNLDDKYEIENKFANVALENYSQIVYLHTIGIDKFKPRNYPHVVKMETIDPEIYNTNVNSFKYLLKYLITRVQEINSSNQNVKLKTAIIAGTSDKHTPFVIEDFCESKFILRQYLLSYVKIFPQWFSGLSINITSTITKTAVACRPYADTEYWFTPQEVVHESIEALLSSSLGYEELDLYKHSPHYVEGYYDSDKLLYEKWSKETGYTKSTK